MSEAGYDALAVSLIKVARLRVCAQTEGVTASRASGIHRVTQSTPLFSLRAQSKLGQTSNALICLLCARNVNRKSTLAQELKERACGKRKREESSGNSPACLGFLLCVSRRNRICLFALNWASRGLRCSPLGVGVCPNCKARTTTHQTWVGVMCALQ